MMTEAETMPKIYDCEEMAACAAADVSYPPALPAAPADATPLPVEPTPPAPPKRLSLAEINDRARASIPSHWLKGPIEPWRPYLHWYI